MVKSVTKYVCTNCGAQYSAWAGRCAQCGEWNTLEEEVTLAPQASAGPAKRGAAGKPLSARGVSTAVKHQETRIPTLMPDVDVVLGGGLVPGGVLLIAGQPGIGKSTLLLQIANNVAKSRKVLYVSGEESEHQIGMRAERLGAGESKLELATSNIADDVATTIMGGAYDLVVVDSIQTMKIGRAHV